VIEESGAGYCVPYEEEKFAAAIVKLVAAPDEARAMGTRGRLYVEKHRAYGAIANTVEREYLRIVSSRTT
jgi:glycosyltransferase involved in cell wall biosynthesis